MRLFASLTLFCLVLSPWCGAQQVSFRDLTASWRVPDDHIPSPPADVCPQVNHTISDGAITEAPSASKNNDKSLELAIVHIDSPRISIGGEFTATVHLKNIGSAAVRIPWQSDGEKVVRLSADGTEEKYEVADVNFRLSTLGNNHAPMPLQSEGALFAHPQDPMSYLRLEPGQWVEIKAKGTVECGLDQCPGNLAADEHAVLTAWWYQRVLTHRVKDCNDDHGSSKIREVESAPFSVVVRAATAGGDSASFSSPPVASYR